MKSLLFFFMIMITMSPLSAMETQFEDFCHDFSLGGSEFFNTENNASNTQCYLPPLHDLIDSVDTLSIKLLQLRKQYTYEIFNNIQPVALQGYETEFHVTHAHWKVLLLGLNNDPRLSETSPAIKNIIERLKMEQPFFAKLLNNFAITGENIYSIDITKQPPLTELIKIVEILSIHLIQLRKNYNYCPITHQETLAYYANQFKLTKNYRTRVLNALNKDPRTSNASRSTKKVLRRLNGETDFFDKMKLDVA